MGWSSAIANIAMTLYRFYGDKTILENVSDTIVRFVDFNLKRAGKLNPFLLFKRYKYRNMIIKTGFHYGEWLEPGSKMFRDYIRDLFYPDTEVTTAWFYMTVRQLAEMAEILGKVTDTQRYRALQEKLKTVYQEKIDPERIVLMGDSTGGALAAAVCQKARDEGLPMPILQMLFYPVTDNAMTHKSMDEYAMGSWSKTANRHMWNMYLKNGDHGQLRYAAPLQSDNFADLPDSYVEVCEMDCLRDEGIAYAEKMKEEGVTVELHQVERAYHGYDGHFESPLTRRELAHRVAFMRGYLLQE